MITNSINHCELTAQIEDKMNREDFEEAVMDRAGEIILTAQGLGDDYKKHELPGVELVAQAIAIHVIDQGAARVASDIGVNLSKLKTLAASQHISSC